MNAPQLSLDVPESKETWSVVVLYDDSLTRQRAMAICDHLVTEFWREIEFKFHWWRTDFLVQQEMAATAAENAADADFLIVSCLPESELSPGMKAWFETWANKRAGLEGAFIDLTEAAGSTLASESTQRHLRDVARRAGMDYLTKLPPALRGTIPDSFESAATRAGEMTSVLDGILNQWPPPSHFGLNE